MSRPVLNDTTLIPAAEDPGFLLREFGFRRCYRRPSAFHGVGNLKCNCLRVEIPIEARAKSFGRLATGHAEMASNGRVERSFEYAEEAMPGWRKAWTKQGGAR